MGRFKLRLKLQGLELEVEGTRDEVPQMAGAIGNQLAGLLLAGPEIIEGRQLNDTPDVLPAIAAPTETKPNRKRSARRKPSTGTTTDAPSVDETVDWLHDPAKWGAPNQSWRTLEKSIWLLYVVSRETGKSDLSGKAIELTFNKHFRQAGRIMVGNVNRDLGKAKTKSPAVVAEDTTKKPTTWFLTHAGEATARELVAQALGTQAPKLDFNT